MQICLIIGLGMHKDILEEDGKMKIAKRQLKRIIKEEYSKLKRRGLINEVYMDDTTIQDEIAKIDDAIDNLLSMGMDPRSLRDEIHRIADDVTTRDHGQWHDSEDSEDSEDWESHDVDVDAMRKY